MTNNCTEQLQHLFRELKDQKLRSESLENIRNIISNNSSDVVDIIKENGLKTLFKWITIKNKSELTTLCDILKLCFEMYKPGEVVVKNISQFMYSLRYHQEIVRDFAIDEVYKGATMDLQVFEPKIFDDMFVAVAQMVADSQMNITKRAITTTLQVPPRLYPRILDQLEVLLQYDTCCKCNVFEVIVNISMRSQELANMCEEHGGYIKFMLSELKRDDVLYQLNILELLSKLAVKSHGVELLVKLGGLNQILELMSIPPDSTASNMLVAGCIKFFTSIGREFPREILERYPVISDMIFNAIESNDEYLLPVAMESLALIGYSVEGKLSLAALGSKFISAVEKIGQLVKSYQIEHRKQAVRCFAELIGYQNDPSYQTIPVDHRVVLMTREWFRSISIKPTSIEVVFELCRNPFKDITSAGFILLEAVCQYSWGQEMVAKCPGLIEYLLNRSQINEDYSNKAKYDIIEKLSKSNAFDPSTTVRFLQYVKEGPFYKEIETDVAVAVEEREN